MFSATNIHFEVADRTRGIGPGGIGTFQALVNHLGLADAIDDELHLLKFHLPYHESDHVLNIAYNILCGGTCLEDIELRRNDEVFLDALGADRIPDPTTSGDFCRRFGSGDIETLLEVINRIRQKVWARQPTEFFELAKIDMDGSLVSTTGECKKGMDISYNGVWGYHPLLISLANTREILDVFNRSGNRPSYEGAAARVDKAIQLCLESGFRHILLRGDNDFSQTAYLDGWDDDSRVTFIFGMDSRDNLKAHAEEESTINGWRKLHRPAGSEVRTQPRERPENVKERIVQERMFLNKRLTSEEVAEFEYQPTACRKTYRMVVVRKNITVQKGEAALFDDIVYLFYITNDWKSTAEEIVFSANDRCEQENLIEQLKNGVHSFKAPLDTLESNWAYMVMSSLAWTLKSWWALMLPEKPGRWLEKHKSEKQTVLKMEFKKFVNNFIRIPCQIVRTSRRIIYRLLSWNPWQHVLFRLVAVLRR